MTILGRNASAYNGYKVKIISCGGKSCASCMCAIKDKDMTIVGKDYHFVQLGKKITDHISDNDMLIIINTRFHTYKEHLGLIPVRQEN